MPAHLVPRIGQATAFEQRHGAGSTGVAVLGTVLFNWLPEHGWFEATGRVLWITVGLYCLAFLAAFLLPMRAREDAAAH